MKLNLDCQHYRGDRPCLHQRLCDGCPQYSPCDHADRQCQILIIKTAAMGDVLRTTPILPALRGDYLDAHITWLTAQNAAPLLRGNPDIDEVVALEDGSLATMFPRSFHLILSLDKSPVACALASVLKAGEKRGMGLSEWGTAFPFSRDADYHFSLGLSDELKFRENTKTYPEMIFDVCGLRGTPQPPTLVLELGERQKARALLAELPVGLDSTRVGVVLGAGSGYANKTPSVGKWCEIIGALHCALPADVKLLVLSGPDDEIQAQAVAEAAGDTVVAVPPAQDVRIHAAVLELMDVVICGDTLALHIATAFRKPVVALFGPTCPAEIDLFQRGVKAVSPVDCAPCYRSECDSTPNCMDLISSADLVSSLLRLLPRSTSPNRGSEQSG